MTPSDHHALAELVAATHWVDTHEHLIEERHALDEYELDTWGGDRAVVRTGWRRLLGGYPSYDLTSAGLPPAALERALSPDLTPDEQWAAVEPFFGACRPGGFLRAVDSATEQLFGLTLAADTVAEIDARMRALAVPGYYARLLREDAGVERCQVNSIEANPFCASDAPDLLEQDIEIVLLARGEHPEYERRCGIAVETLDDYLSVIERCFAEYGSAAVAVKCPWAYVRPLAVEPHEEQPDEAFERLRAGTASPAERRAVEDFLFDRCLRLATEAGLPVKLHMGYLGGNAQPMFAHVRDHVNDLVALVLRHPQTSFVLMHMAWPHQEELLALVKHFPNACVDMCWAWSLAPLSAIEFVQRFLTCAPASKLLCFGGDVVTPELVVGHAALARRGLAHALGGLVEQAWLSEREALALVPVLMHENADRLLPSPRGVNA